MKLKYDFKNPELLELALTQSGADAVHNNERLEFVGDRVLGLSVATLLYDMFPDEHEGELARRHAMLVSTGTLARVATELGLDKEIHHGHMTAGRTDHICANAMEAVFGAIFIDDGVIWRLPTLLHPKMPKLRYRNMCKKIQAAHCQNTNIWRKPAHRTSQHLTCA